MNSCLKKYEISEVFASLQGEGSLAGTKAVFVRFSGCNLRCEFCDTNYDLKMSMSLEEVLEEISAKAREKGWSEQTAWHVVFTGGEPLLQLDERLVQAVGSKTTAESVQVETNGTIFPSDLSDRKIHYTVSPKDRNHTSLFWATEIKIVYTGAESEAVARNLSVTWPLIPIYLQPCDRGGKNNLSEVCEFIMRSDRDFYLSIQAHKLAGLE